MDKTRPTIAAIATPTGSGGIGIIKISGARASHIAERLFRRVRSKTGERVSIPEEKWETHRFYYGHIVDPDTRQMIDEVMIVLMRGPRSYTREDVVEIHLHSGSAVLRAVLERVLDSGAVLAEPGEFTKRAFLNGRIDLTQAEGIIDLIHARTDRSREIAAVQVRGEMAERIAAIRREMLEILAELEGAIDFPDEVDDDLDFIGISNRLQIEVIHPLSRLIEQSKSGRLLRDGLKVIIAGKPNVGKSSLMNRLMGTERAIVTPIPGTTRDIIEDSASIQGIPVVFTDTAGLHDTQDPVERIGIDRAHASIQDADLLLWVTEAHVPITKEDFGLVELFKNQKMIWVANKSDLLSQSDSIDFPERYAAIPRLLVSAKENKGIDSLKNEITNMCIRSEFIAENPIVPNLRQKVCIESGYRHAKAAAEGLKTEMPSELLAIDLQAALDALGEVIGITFREDILDRVFSRFCIGK
ncbi:MAG: tRNA uridine-5-carboxymethylaminomethyl(34) synthesis GTPase MnmE [Desulfococcaceae bacterium]